MKHNITSLNERIQQIVEHSYKLLCNKIAGNNIRFDNEASFQHQFSIILNTVGKLYEFGETDRFKIELEKEIALNNPTWKSQKRKARCDIWLTLSDGKESVGAAIELKFFKKAQGETTTDNRFAIFCDLENLEHYKQDQGLLCYEIVLTDNKNYTNNQGSSYLNIGDGVKYTGGKIESNNRKVQLTGNYTFHWDEYASTDEEGYFFLKLNL